MSHTTYTKELELLIIEKLLPVYYKYHREHGTVPDKINKDLLDQIKSKRALPRLLIDKKDWNKNA
jgi:hypothetical protein